jgi:hypothetical protein
MYFSIFKIDILLRDFKAKNLIILFFRSLFIESLVVQFLYSYTFLNMIFLYFFLQYIYRNKCSFLFTIIIVSLFLV